MTKPELEMLAISRLVPNVAPSRKKRNRWGVVLAGGDGVRLRPLTRLICSDDRPKQFCPLFGERTLLEQTIQRSELIIPSERLLVSLACDHVDWYSGQAGLRPSQCVVQPGNKGTAPAILHSLLSIAKLDHQALVAILPCDHHYPDELSFAFDLESAFETAARRSDVVVLLGAKPDYPEVEYGWIEPGSPLSGGGSEVFQVWAFEEKPTLDLAQKLFKLGCLWNTFVMVGTVQAFLRIVRPILGELLDLLGSAPMWAGKETHIQPFLYVRVPLVSFSADVLSAAESSRLAVLRLEQAGWSDLGDPERALLAIRDGGHRPMWLNEWATVSCLSSCFAREMGPTGRSRHHVNHAVDASVLIPTVNENCNGKAPGPGKRRDKTA